MDDVWRIVIAILNESWDRYGLRLYGNVDRDTLGYVIRVIAPHRYDQRRGFFSIKQHISFDALEDAMSKAAMRDFVVGQMMKQVRLVAEARDSKGKEAELINADE